MQPTTIKIETTGELTTMSHSNVRTYRFEDDPNVVMMISLTNVSENSQELQIIPDAKITVIIEYPINQLV